MKKIQKLLSIVLALILALSVLTLAGVNAAAYEQDSGSHYLLPTGETLATAARFALGETVHGAIIANGRNRYRLNNDALRDITFTVRTDKALTFTVISEKAEPFKVGAQQYTTYAVEIPANSSDAVALTDVPVGNYFIQFDGKGAAGQKTEFCFRAGCAGLPTLRCAINHKTMSLTSGDTAVLTLSDLSVDSLNHYWEAVDNPLTTDIDERKLVSVTDQGLVTVAFPSNQLRFDRDLTCVVRAVFYYSTDGNPTEDFTKSCTVTLNPPNIFLDPYVTSLTLNANETKTIKATTNVKNASIAWSSSDETVATVNSLGEIRAYEKEGIITITAAIRYNGEVLRIRREIRVIAYGAIDPDPTRGLFSAKAASIEVGKTQELPCTITYSDGTTAKPDGKNVTFTSSDTSVATVTDKGVVKGIDEGSAVITATVTTKTGTFQDTCRVTVNDPLSGIPKPIRKFVRVLIQIVTALFRIVIALLGGLTNK